MMESSIYWWLGGGAACLAALGAVICVWRRRGKRVYDTVGMELLLDYAQKHLNQHPEDASIAFVRFARESLPEEAEKLGIPKSASHVILAGVLNAEGDGIERWVHVFLARKVDSGVEAALAENVYIIER